MKRLSLLILALLMMLMLALVVPLAAQGGTDSVTYNGVSFELPQDLAVGVMTLRIAGDDPAIEQPGGAVPPHIAFTLLNGVPNSQTNTTVGEIHVYRTADFVGYSIPTDEFDLLNSLLANQTDLSTYAQVDLNSNSLNLPYLPGIAAAQVYRINPEYVSTESLTGVRYLTIFSQDVSPFTADRVWYTFQGLSKDASYYVAVNIPVNASVLPADIPSDFNYDDFNASYEQYLQDTLNLLNSAAPDSFSPSPVALDGLVQSIHVPVMQDIVAGNTENQNPVSTPEVSSTEEATAGVLAGTWNLVSYGPEAAQVPVLENAPITLTFGAEGASGNGSCNSYSTTFTFNNDELTFGEVRSTLMACEQPILDQELNYFKLLQVANRFAIDGDQLLIYYGVESGEIAPGVMTFTRAEAAG
ncbi:MAG TPA: META domain-containing protein [Phototrophicaceae bacterium]|jgi:heat shock protein HslJ|nr:META domain-containing protein [Phototrophicaceae bacterium]